MTRNSRIILACCVLLLPTVYVGGCSIRAWKANRLLDRINNECNMYASYISKLTPDYCFLNVTIDVSNSKEDFDRLLSILSEQTTSQHIWLNLDRSDWGDEILSMVKSNLRGYESVDISCVGTTMPFTSAGIEEFSSNSNFVILRWGSPLEE